MNCICEFETDSFRTLRSHFAANHSDLDFLDHFSDRIEINCADREARGLKEIIS